MNKQKIVFDVVGALIEDQGRILVCQRHDADRFGSLWEFPGGKVEKGEDKITALKREIKEELGIDIQVGKLINTFEDEISTMKITVYLYSCNVIAGEPSCLECQDFRWARLDEIGKFKLAPADKKIYNYLLTIIKRQA